MQSENSLTSSYPIPENEAERLAALSSYQLIDTLPEQDFEELTALASQICQTPIALITLIDETRQWFKSAHGVDVKETPREIAFCAHTIVQEEQILIIKDTREDKRFVANPLVKGDPGVIFYAGISLVNEEGYPIGTLCVIDHTPKELSQGQLDALRILARQVLTQMELRRKVAILEKANTVLLEANTFIQKFASTAAHDIKNPLSGILLTSQALKQHLEVTADEKTANLFNLNISACKRLLKLVDEMLEYSKTPGALLTNQAELNLHDLISQVINLIVIPEYVHFKLPEKNHSLICSSVALEQIFLNLLTNAVRYNDKKKGLIDISFEDEVNFYKFKISDNGPGIDNKHLLRIFEKHYTLNNTDRFLKKGTGIGLYTVKALIEKLEGEITATSRIGEGTTFEFSIKKPESIPA